MLEEVHQALQPRAQESWLSSAPCVAAGMNIRASGAEKASTEVQRSQSQPHAESQPSPSQSGAPTYADFSRYLDEVKQVQAGTLSTTEFDRRRASEVASIQRSSAGRSPSAAAQPSPSLQTLAPPAVPSPASALPTAASPSSLPLRQVQPAPSDSPASATLSIAPVAPVPAAPDQLSAGRPIRKAAIVAAANLASVSRTLFCSTICDS